MARQEVCLNVGNKKVAKEIIVLKEAKFTAPEQQKRYLEPFLETGQTLPCMLKCVKVKDSFKKPSRAFY